MVFRIFAYAGGQEFQNELAMYRFCFLYHIPPKDFMFKQMLSVLHELKITFPRQKPRLFFLSQSHHFYFEMNSHPSDGFNLVVAETNFIMQLLRSKRNKHISMSYPIHKALRKFIRNAITSEFRCSSIPSLNK